MRRKVGCRCSKEKAIYANSHCPPHCTAVQREQVARKLTELAKLHKAGGLVRD